MNVETKAILVGAVRRIFVLALIVLAIRFGLLPLTNWLMTGQHPLLEGLRQHVTKNLPEYLTFIGALAIAFVCTWPTLIPRSAQEWWTWCRDAFQTAVPAARARTEAHSQSSVTTHDSVTTQEASKTSEPPNPIPAAAPPQPK